MVLHAWSKQKKRHVSLALTDLLEEHCRVDLAPISHAADWLAMGMPRS